MSCQRRQGASNYIERHLHTFHIITMGNTLCGCVVLIAIPNENTLDDTTDSLSLKFLLWYKLIALENTEDGESDLIYGRA